MVAQRRFSARATQVGPISREDADAFLDSNHRSGATGEALKTLAVGLTKDGELLAVAQFCAPRTAAMKRSYSTELLRMAFAANTRIPGGASKLIQAYRRLYSPADIFTYQDGTGEVTAVYEHAGFTFVRQARTKQYLVAPGKTLATASRREALGMAYAVRYGPDRILGSKLGEVLDMGTGERKSNKQIFIEELGWHVEETPGDKIFEWFNPDVTFYTYKVSATDSDKYYYGVSHVKVANADETTCLNDGYFGSGSKHPANKFQNWKRKHARTLTKEIISIHATQAKAYAEEKRLVGDAWSTDVLCLNSTPGGKDGGLTHRGSKIELKECNVHGESLHNGSACLKCSAAKRFTERECSIHGLAPHTGYTCLRCSNGSTYTSGTCLIHGLVTLRGQACVRCTNEAMVSTRDCTIHGLGKFIGEQCYRCIDGGFSQRDCSTHGLTTFRGEGCVKCSAASIVTQATCPTHGEVAHRAGKCTACSNGKAVSMRVCPIHGETKHQGAKCGKCTSAALYTEADCVVHGRGKHRSGRCIRCTLAEAKARKALPAGH